jgi:RecB family exonuclease
MNLKYGPYSPSRLEVGNCRYSFRRQYIDENRSNIKTESLPQARGSVVHEMFEHITRELVLTAPNTNASNVDRAMVAQRLVEAVNRHHRPTRTLHRLRPWLTCIWRVLRSF